MSTSLSISLYRLGLVYASLVLLYAIPITAQPRQVTELRTGWKFARGANDGAYRPDFADSGWRTIDIPHDWGVDGGFLVDGDGDTGKLPWKGEGWYRRTLDIPSTDAGRQYYLVCDGIMAFPRIYVNGRPAGSWDYGYNSFYVDITPYLEPGGRNVLAIHADTRNHDSRWYPGGGIYRKITLVSTDPVHVGIWGTSVTTPIVKPHYADVRIATTVRTEDKDPRDIEVHYSILNRDGRKIAGTISPLTTAHGQEHIQESTITLANPRRWDVADPYLYSLVTEVFRDGRRTDSVATTFGVRTIRFTAQDGFYLNDRRVQLKGVNLHHDHGPLGAAFNYRAMQRQLEIMKDMGCNAIRTSHNVAAPELLDLCDHMGLLVLDEIFDKYDGKADITDTTDFEAFALRNVRNFIERDRNHPCVFLWSVGNEIGDVQWNKHGGFAKLRTMVNFVRRFDDTRPVTLVCDSYGSAALRHFDYYDVHSWNYGRRYSLARQLEPGKAVIISESASTLSTRGFYELPLPNLKTDFTRSLQVSSYDLNAPDWAELADDDFMWQQEEPYVAGEFVWTGFDYLGEPTPYNNKWALSHGMTDREASRSSYFGIVDLCGIPKDRYYLYKSYWKPDETTVHILPHWNWPDRIGQTVPVFVYTNGDCAELFLNGRSIGMRCKDPKSSESVDRFRLMWEDVIYETGTVHAVAYKEGAIIGEARVTTAGEPASIRLTPDRTVLHSDGTDLSYVLVEAVDKNGLPCPLANDKISIQVSGAGRLAGVGNGNPQSLESFRSPEVNLFFGKAMIIVRAGNEPGKISVQASARGMTSATFRLNTE